MSVGKIIEAKGGHIAGFQEEISRKAENSDEDFFRFFSNAKNTDESFISGAWDFSIHIAEPCRGFLKDPSEKTALEIGYGGGRVLAAAAQHFGFAHGVDIHGNPGPVKKELKKRGIENVELHETDGRALPFKDGMLDFIFSLIVFQHMETLQIVTQNIEESFRTLKSGGLALFYYARPARLSVGTSSGFLAALDTMLEALPLTKPYEEVQARVNETNLLISERKMKELCRKAGFAVRRTGYCYRRVPDQGDRLGALRYILVEKP